MTVRTMVKSLTDEYAWVNDEPTPVDPSPKDQLKEYGVDPPLAEAVKITCCPS